VTAAVSDDGGQPTGDRSEPDDRRQPGGDRSDGDDQREFVDGTATVLVSNRQDVPVDEDALAGLAVATLRAEGVPAFELSVSFVDGEEMSELHGEYLGDPGPTDVLSFPLDDADGEGIRLLGDVVVCPAYAAGNNDDLAAELRLLLVHGVLHLLGHDHEDDAERAEMWTKQERYSGVAVDATGVGRGTAR
jgi:probable rRNA maturation factor